MTRGNASLTFPLLVCAMCNVKQQKMYNTTIQVVIYKHDGNIRMMFEWENKNRRRWCRVLYLKNVGRPQVVLKLHFRDCVYSVRG
ncbi:hypothetical protein CPC08DRAFT_133138 [Agrocybe pediades]|nr:hypothetical protein CPC08DRAFT_133138 [Agrocybe pediades]